eukprot:965067-Amphidinium_carterae.1
MRQKYGLVNPFQKPRDNFKRSVLSVSLEVSKAKVITKRPPSLYQHRNRYQKRVHRCCNNDFITRSKQSFTRKDTGTRSVLWSCLSSGKQTILNF